MYDIIVYQTFNGKEPFTEWLESLDVKTQDRILNRILRMQAGNLGDHKKIGKNLFESRLFFNGGIRIYFGMDGEKNVVLLCGGDKSTQNYDIEKAKQYWENYKNG